MFQILKPIVSLLMFLTVLFFIHTMLTITTSFAPWLSVTVSSGCAALAAWFSWRLIAGKRTGTLVAIAGDRKSVV